MKTPRELEIDWHSLERAFERFDPSWEGEPLPYLNLRTGRVSYFGIDKGVDWDDTLDFDRHVAITLSDPALSERHGRMRAFAATVDPELSGRLRAALLRVRKVASFYAILEEQPQILLRWQRAFLPRVRELILTWIAEERLIPRNPPPWS